MGNIKSALYEGYLIAAQNAVSHGYLDEQQAAKLLLDPGWSIDEFRKLQNHSEFMDNEMAKIFTIAENMIIRNQIPVILARQRQDLVNGGVEIPVKHLVDYERAIFTIRIPEWTEAWTPQSMENEEYNTILDLPNHGLILVSSIDLEFKN